MGARLWELRPWTPVVVALVLLANGCGGSDADQREASDLPGHTYGADTTSTAAAQQLEDADEDAGEGIGEDAPPPTAPSGSPAATPAPPSAEPTVANRSVRDDPSGFRLTLVVADKLEFGSTEDIRMQLEFENVSDRVLRHDSNQKVTFAMSAADGSSEPRWSDVDCDPQAGHTENTGLLELAPGESGSSIGDYPARPVPGGRGGRDPDSCRLPAGDYLVAGKLDWCPDDAVLTAANGQPYCDPDGVVHVVSAPLTIRIG